MIVALAYLSFVEVNAASVKATVDTIEVVKGNPVTLYLKAIGDSAVFPNILMVDTAPVTSTSTSSSRSLSLSNGKTTSEVSTTKIIQFIPEQNITIPSYAIDILGKKYYTDPIDIKVLSPNSTKGQRNELFLLEMRANKTKIHVGESFMLTVYLSLRNDVKLAQGVQYTKPNLSEFVVASDGEQKGYMKGRYQVQEIRYIVTATKEGNYTITPAHAKVGVADGSRRDIFGMSFGVKWYEIASSALSINVLPQPKDVDLIGDFNISVKIDTNKTEANKPVNLTVKIEGKGNLANFEFPKYEINGVTVYGDEAKIDTQVIGDELYSIYTKHFAFISDNDFHIPERSFAMLDTKIDKVKSINVGAYDIKIKHDSRVTPITPIEKHSSVKTNLSQISDSKKTIVENEVEVKTTAWWMIVASFLTGMFVVYAFRFIPIGKVKPYKENDALKILYAHMGEDVEVEEMVRKLYAKKNGDKSVQIDKKRLKKMVEHFR